MNRLKMRERKSNFERAEALATFRNWFSNCGQTLAIVGLPQTGKTFFANQLTSLPECVASHFCRCDEPQSSESATLIRSLGEQLMRRFPNLVLPRLATVTLLRDPATALEHFLQMPLETMPRPSKPVFVVIDNVHDESTRRLVEMIRIILPRWVRTVITTQKLNPSSSSDIHIMEIGSEDNDLEKFIRSRLPHCSTADVLNASNGSWFYVDQMSKAIELGVLSMDIRPPNSSEQLMESIGKHLPLCFVDIIRLVKASRNRPNRQQLLAVGQILTSQELSSLERDINFIRDVICQNSPDDIFDVSETWLDFIDLEPLSDDFIRCHSSWAEHYKTKRKKSAQDLIELAYHLTRCSYNPQDALQVLKSVGAGKLVLKCEVIDPPTTILLGSAGAVFEHKNFDVVYACSLGNVKYLEKIIRESKPSNFDICFGLITAAARGKLEICRFLVENYPQVAVSSCCGEWNALRSAACYGQLEILDLLLSKGINVDESGHSDRTALRAAAWSGQLAAVQLLLQNNADVDRRDSENRTALMAAAFMGHRDVVNVILQYGTDVNAVDNSGATALHLNLSNCSKNEEHKETTELLIQNGASCVIEDANGRVALHLAAYHGNISLPLILEHSTFVDVQDKMGQTPLILAASQGQLESAKYLVEMAKADVDCIDMNGRTALQWAAINGHSDTVQYLCSVGSDEAHKDNDGALALHYAVAHDNVELTRILINEHTVQATDRYGQHPLLVACGHGNIQVISELITHSAPVNLAALDGRTPLSVAAMAGHSSVVELLAPYINDWTQTDHDGTPLVHALILSNQTFTAEVLLNVGASTSAKDAHGRTCAHLVASTNDVNAAKMLRRVGASFEVVDEGGRTVLMTAIWARHLQITLFLLDHCGVDANRTDHQGATALSIASQIGDRDLVALLLRFGAEPTIRDAMGRTAYDVARISGHDIIASMLKSANGSSDSSGIGSSVPNSPMDASKTRTRRATSSVRAQLLK